MTRSNAAKWFMTGGALLGCFLLNASRGYSQSRTTNSGSSSFNNSSSGSGNSFGSSSFSSSQSSSSFGSSGTSAGLGSNSNSGNSMTGSSTTGTTTVSTVVSTSNLFRSHFANPMSAGLPSGTRQSGFGSPLYSTTTTGTTGNTGPGGTANINSRTNSTTGSVFGASSVGVRRAPAYSTSLGFEYKQESSDAVLAKVMETLANASRLPNRKNIVVVLDGNTFVLQGTAANDHERRLTEALVRLTPGVREIRNEIEVRGISE
jgi:osmotically-inducible protein OsmY